MNTLHGYSQSRYDLSETYKEPTAEQNFQHITIIDNNHEVISKRVDGVTKNGDNTSDFTVSTVSYASDAVFEYAQSLSLCSSAYGLECLQVSQRCVNEAIKTGQWSDALGFEADFKSAQQALELLSVAARWKAEDERKGSALRECFETLRDASRCGLQALQQGAEEWADGDDTTKAQLGLLSFVQSLIDARL